MRRTTINIGPGALIEVGEKLFCVLRWETSSSVLAREFDTGSDRVLSLAEISTSFSTTQRGPQIDLSAVDDDAWNIAIDRARVLRPLLALKRRTISCVDAAAEELDASRATIYRWLDRLELYGTVSCLLRKTRTDKGNARLERKSEAILKEVLISDYLTSQKKSPTSVHREIERRCRKEKTTIPSKTTVLRRIEAIVPEEREKKRKGRNAALKHRPNKGSLPGVDHVHAIWQIDHTLVDLILVDEKDRIPIGRPWITVVIDVFSRMVVGWYISFDPPGALGTGVSISEAILPKDAALARLGVDLPWPCQGKPGRIQADNAKEFRGNMLKNACNEHGFDMIFRKVKRPNYGAHIERLLGTLLEEIHGLEGTTFSNTEQRGDYDSDAHACMTIEEFETWLANLILGQYHHRKHSELGCPPIKKYRDGILGDGATPGIGLMPIAADPEKMRIDFLPIISRTVQPYGVLLDHIKYHSPVLDKWIGSTEPKSAKNARQFTIRRDPRNISFVYFWDPDIQQYFQIPYRQIHRPAISLWELRQINAYLSDQGKKDIDEDTIFKALDEMRSIEDKSKDLTRRQRMERERRRQHRKRVPRAPKAAELPDGPQPTLDRTSGEGASTFDLSNIKPFDEIEPT